MHFQSMSGIKEQLDDEIKDIKGMKDQVSGMLGRRSLDEPLKGEQVETRKEKAAEESSTDGDDGDKKEKEVRYSEDAVEEQKVRRSDIFHPRGGSYADRGRL